VRLSRFCSEKLDETEKRITILQDQEGNVLEKPFMQENESEEDK